MPRISSALPLKSNKHQSFAIFFLSAVACLVGGVRQLFVGDVEGFFAGTVVVAVFVQLPFEVVEPGTVSY